MYDLILFNSHNTAILIISSVLHLWAVKLEEMMQFSQRILLAKDRFSRPPRGTASWADLLAFYT